MAAILSRPQYVHFKYNDFTIFLFIYIVFNADHWKQAVLKYCIVVTDVLLCTNTLMPLLWRIYIISKMFPTESCFNSAILSQHFPMYSLPNILALSIPNMYLYFAAFFSRYIHYFLSSICYSPIFPNIYSLIPKHVSPAQVVALLVGIFGGEMFPLVLTLYSLNCC